MRRSIPALLALLGCAAEEPGHTDTDDLACSYPDAPDTMAVSEPLPAYRWPTAVHGDGRELPLELATVICGGGDIDWSPFDVLLFVSIPEW